MKTSHRIAKECDKILNRMPQLTERQLIRQIFILLKCLAENQIGQFRRYMRLKERIEAIEDKL